LRERIAMRGDVRCDLAVMGRAASLSEMLELVRAADVVISADSYLAHAGPALGARTIVIARKGLEPWRVPSPSSFYLSSSTDAASVAASIQALLREWFAASKSLSPRERPESRRLIQAASALRSALDAPIEQLLASWQECLDAHNAVVAALPDWPRGWTALVEDHPYGRLMPRAPARGNDDAAVRGHLTNRFAECENSNLWKLVMGAA
jgi:hypothetical protein